ncbi:MAG: hypothetical protein QY322_00965 [bacterium]|nr:MAG: hypothetical protein QY322_00965 [bacterium]
MKIIVLHGNDTQKSYLRLTKFIEVAKKRKWQVVDYSLTEVENQSLFDENKFFILKDHSLLDVKILDKLKKYSGNLVIYHNAKIPAPTLKKINPDTAELFELPVILWKFLDSFNSGTGYSIKLFHELLKTQPVEYILAMIAWKLKDKYRRNPTPDVGLLISELAEIDVKAKTGKADLVLSLDLLLAKKIR